MSAPQGQFTFNYTKYQSPWLSVDQLDALAKAVFQPDGMVGQALIIWAGIKLVLAVAYIFVRKTLVDQELQIEKQQYEVQQTGGNQNEVNNQDPPSPK